MEAWILDQDFHTLAVADAFESFIWTVRYNTYGDFEFYAPTDIQPLEYIKLDNYIYLKESDRVMILESVSNSTDAENGSHLTLSGRSLESILERRVIWTETVFENTPVCDAIKRLIDENIITCKGNSSRIIPHFRFKVNDSLSKYVTSPEYGISTYYWGENLYDVITSICKAYDLGFRITINDIDSADSYTEMVFELYEGVDHSYDQEENPHVVFSPKYENLFGSQYYKTKEGFSNAAIVIGSDADDRETRWQESMYKDAFYTGLERREIYVDGSSIQYPVGEVSEEQKQHWKDYYENEGNRLEWSEEKIELMYNKKIEELIAADLASKMPAYLEQLTEEGRLALADTLPVEAFDGEVDATIQYVYKKDFDLGDVVQVVNESGMEATARITEVMMSHDITGVHVTPTFTNTLDEY